MYVRTNDRKVSPAWPGLAWPRLASPVQTNQPPTDRPTDRPTDGATERPTDLVNQDAVDTRKKVRRFLGVHELLSHAKLHNTRACARTHRHARKHARGTHPSKHLATTKKAKVEKQTLCNISHEIDCAFQHLTNIKHFLQICWMSNIIFIHLFEYRSTYLPPSLTAFEHACLAACLSVLQSINQSTMHTIDQSVHSILIFI